MTYRISLRSSSLWEPRHPLLKVLISLLHRIECTERHIEARPTLLDELQSGGWFIVIALDGAV
jgi:hypothetical protein